MAGLYSNPLTTSVNYKFVHIRQNNLVMRLLAKTLARLAIQPVCDVI